MNYAISSEGLALIQHFEGFNAAPIALPNSTWVVGYGHVRVGAAGEAVTEAQARALLALDLAPVEAVVNGAVTQKLTQPQFDALVSFAFSVGAEAFAKSQVLRKLNKGQWVAAACAIDAWRKSEVAGELEVVEALVCRRAAEKALFLKGSPHNAAPSALMRAKLDHAASILGAPPARATASRARAAKADPARRIVEILNSEPATAAVLAAPPIIDEEPVEEITTAHARPVQRTLEEGRRALWREEQKQLAAKARKALGFNWRKVVSLVRGQRAPAA
ncbi:MAG: lysozyme [Hyphomonadaceae bacterium]|nr:lysozyme [Hyphomonadaceae bacterium]